MILTGQYDSPFSRRIAISLRILGFDYIHDARSVFGDFDAVRQLNPLGRIPALTLDSGAVLIEFAAILDWLDEKVGPERALIPWTGDARRLALRTIALATGGIEKFGAAAYERIIRPSAYRWPEWIARCRTQGEGALRELERLRWQPDARVDQAQISAACLIAYVKMADPEFFDAVRYPNLAALSDRLEARSEFLVTRVIEYAVPRGS